MLMNEKGIPEKKINFTCKIINKELMFFFVHHLRNSIIDYIGIYGKSLKATVIRNNLSPKKAI